MDASNMFLASNGEIMTNRQVFFSLLLSFGMHKAGCNRDKGFKGGKIQTKVAFLIDSDSLYLKKGS